MVKVFVAQHHAEAHLVCALLRADGIEAEVRGEVLFTTVEAASVIPGARPEVWVSDPAQIPRATVLITRFSKGETAAGESASSWHCPTCGEAHEPQFNACWNCGTARLSPLSAG
jgi:predicted RNA-binding Zn-ribbon protein involved in translation (DUF1610 family)